MAGGGRSSDRGDALARSVGLIFRNARREQRLSQEQVAALSAGHAGGVSRALISAIERGRSLPGIEALVCLSRVLNVEPREILERVDLGAGIHVDLTGETPRGLVEKGLEMFYAGEYRHAVAFYDAAADLLKLESSEPDREARELRVWIEIDRSVALRRASAPRAAQSAAQRAVELARDFPELQASAYMTLASVLSMQGLHVLARDTAERALASSEGTGSRNRGRAWAQLAGTLLRAGQFEEARKAYLRARQLAVRGGDVRQQTKAEGNIGSCLAELGRPKQARARFHKALDLARKTGDRPAEALWLVALARAHHAERRFEDAERCCRAAVRIAKPLEQRLTVFRAEWLLFLLLDRKRGGAGNRHRLVYLKKLWRELRDHRGLDEVREFERTVLRAERGGQEETP